ncbi:hypothetical protein RHGRI_009491 [Rhododendron griersonianum]|uniref:Ataxin 2 SM domain-containing protein n=1 Tax=Rhododendron griersonianum TaxID=479676 RepID=A0AAV6KG15_9ERIC|nr:hypothetical protein RHGRI_009491 [Rhododendron griersonianum]
MGCRNREFLGQESSAAPSSLNDALLFTTMCIIGLPVDVHVKDGSIYSGIFHTACVENDYGIVLKKARMTKKGDCNANIAIGDLIETLVVVSEDLVQVVAKGISLPANGVSCNVPSNRVGDVADSIPFIDWQGRNNASCSMPGIMLVDNMFAIAKLLQVGDGRAQGKRFDYKGKSDLEKTHEVLDSGLSCELNGPPDNVDACSTQSKVDQMHQDTASKLLPNGALSDRSAPPVIKMSDQGKERHASEDSLRSNANSLGVSTSGTSFVEGTTESFVSSSSTPTEMVHPKSSISTAKASKLNPGAEVFCPSSVNHRSVTPPAAPAAASVAYIPDNFPVVPIASAQPEIEIGPYVPRSSLPAKLAPYGNLMAGNGFSDSQYSQSIIGHVGGRTQPARYVTQHHSIQAGPAYMQPNSQNVSSGGIFTLLSCGFIPRCESGNGGFLSSSYPSFADSISRTSSEAPRNSTCIAGSAAAQALQLSVTPPYITGVQQQYAVQSHIPIPQPPFPVIRPIPVPGSTGFFSAKFQ